jgi:hypothetical protein
MSYSEAHTAQAEAYPVLGAEYFASRDAAEAFMAHWQEEHAAKVAEEVIKPILDTIHERVNDAFRDHLLSDAEQNLQGTMRDMVEKSVRALIGGEKWAIVKYIEYPHHEGQKVRETLAKLHSDPIKDGRIADLEKEVARLTKDLEWARGR